MDPDVQTKYSFVGSNASDEDVHISVFYPSRLIRDKNYIDLVVLNHKKEKLLEIIIGIDNFMHVAKQIPLEAV